jgi:hypothetical protein
VLRTPGFLILTLAFLLSLSSPPSLRAQSTADHDPLYQAAKADLQAGRAALALEKLNRGLTAGIDDRELRWTYLLAITIAHDALKQPLAVLEAMQHLEQALEAETLPVPPKWRSRLGGMTQRVADLEASVLKTRGALHVASEPPGARVLVDGQAAGTDRPVTTPFTLYLTPGLHQVRVELKGHEVAAETVVIKRGGAARVDHGLVPLTSQVVKERAKDRTGRGAGEDVSRRGAEAQREGRGGLTASAGPPGKTRPSWLDPTWGWVMAGSGAAILFAGIPFTAMAYSDHSSLSKYAKLEQTQENRDAYDEKGASMRKNEALAGVFYGMGATIAAGGAAWLILAYTWESATSPVPDKTAFGLVPTNGGAVMTWVGRF